MAGPSLPERIPLLEILRNSVLTYRLTKLVEVLLSMRDAKSVEADRVHRTKEGHQRSGHVEMGLVGPRIQECAAGSAAFFQARLHPLKGRPCLPGRFRAQTLFYLHATG